jgi:hypothetical protein
MPIVELPRDRWKDELNTFTAAHEGWLASIDVFGSEIGAQHEIRDMPLIGVSADRINHDGAIAVSVARSTADHFTHMIHGVMRIFIERQTDDTPAFFLIESSDGTRTMLRFRTPHSGRP